MSTSTRAIHLCSIRTRRRRRDTSESKETPLLFTAQVNQRTKASGKRKHFYFFSNPYLIIILFTTTPGITRWLGSTHWPDFIGGVDWIVKLYCCHSLHLPLHSYKKWAILWTSTTDWGKHVLLCSRLNMKFDLYPSLLFRGKTMTTSTAFYSSSFFLDSD